MNNALYITGKKESGFTLVELIVSIAILMILSALLIATLDPVGQFQKAQDSRRKSDLSQIQKALESYYQDNGRYPDSSGGTSDANCNPYTYCIKTNSSVNGGVIKWGQAWGNYIGVLPRDTGGRNYIYVSPASPSNGQSYMLYTSLERGKKDPQSCAATGNAKSSTDETCANVPTGVLCGNGNKCNYGITSANVSP